jgi:ketosteroid isomerase-like protein
VTPDDVERLQRHWLDGWNRGDLDTIMAPLAPDIVFSSPGIAMMTRDPSRTTIEGADALREYLATALGMTAAVRYTLRESFAGTDSLVITYSCGRPGGDQKHGADSFRVDADGRVFEWRCHY